MNAALAHSYRYCEEVARREAGNFYPAFLLLPPPRRRAMCALSTFMRIADDLSDEAAPLDVKRRQLAEWRDGLHHAIAGRPQHPSHAALEDIVRCYDIPSRYLEAVIDGVEMDLEPVAYRTFAELRNYCWHVASVVGLSCIHIWGFHGRRANAVRGRRGIAFQLTNILRDLGETPLGARICPARSRTLRLSGGSAPARRVRSGVSRTDAFRDRSAREFYQRGWRLVPCLSPAGQAVFPDDGAPIAICCARLKTATTMFSVAERKCRAGKP